MPECPFMRDLPKERAKIGEKTLQQHWSGLLWTIPCQKKNRETRSTKALTKRYRVILTCLTTHATHIELAGDLSSDSFLLALRRFISRQGCESHAI